MLKLCKWQPKRTERSAGSHSLNSSQLPAPSSANVRTGASRAAAPEQTHKSLAVCFGLVVIEFVSSTAFWFTWTTTSSDTTPMKTPSRSPWRSWGACTSSPLLKSDWGPAGLPDEGVEEWRFTGVIMDSMWNVKKKKVSWEELEPWGGVLNDLRSFVPPEMLSRECVWCCYTSG